MTTDLDSYLDNKDLNFEELIIKSPGSIKTWFSYLEAKKNSTYTIRFKIYERACCATPNSYKLWKSYLTERIQCIRGLCPDDLLILQTNKTFEKSLVFMHKMPRIWIMFLNYLMTQYNVTYIRKWYDNCLKSLPITQHDRIWPIYLKYVKICGVSETAVRVYRRYIKIEPSAIEEYIEFLKSIERYDEAAFQLAKIVNDDDFISTTSKSRHDLWGELCEMISQHPEDIKLNVEGIIRTGIRRYPQEIGNLWVALADYYIRLALFEKARDIFEEAIEGVNTVRDFAIVFDAYTQFEESMVSASMPSANEASEETEEYLEDISTDIDMRLVRLEHLISRRPFLLNSVVLRQNPHNATEWLNRIKLFKPEQAENIIQTYADAVTTIDPQIASGQPHAVWVNFAKFYESNNDLENARAVFERAVNVSYKQVQHLCNVWCEWAEMEIRHENFDESLKLMQRATSLPRGKVYHGAEDDFNVAVQDRLHKSTKLWSFYVDLEESLGSLESTKAVYERVLDLKVATPQMILNYTNLLEENQFFEDSFRVYERGVALFHYPSVMPIWNTYLTKFIARYQGTKLERAREIFEMALERIPTSDSKKIYMLYAKLEEDFGLARRALQIYNRATRACPDEDKLELYNLYIRRATESFGVTKTREIYQKAVEILPENQIKVMCLQFANMEKSLGEIDRARAVFVYGSQFTDPFTNPEYWKEWDDFELQFGNADTYREILRIKRTVEAEFTNKNFVAGILSAANTVGSNAVSGLSNISTDGAAPASAPTQPAGAMALLGQKRKQAEAEMKDFEIDIAEKAVPSAVFGDAKKIKV